MEPHTKSESNTYVRYDDTVEVIEPDEAQTTQKLIESFQRIADTTYKQLGKHVRVSHGKAHGVAVGELKVLENLPEHLSQGLFTRAASYPVIVRLANVPGTIESDASQTERGMALKIFDVNGEKLAGHEGNNTQDFILGDYDRFQAPNMKTFLQLNRGLEIAPHLPQVVKQKVSDLARGINNMLEAVGKDSANLDLIGHSRIHPLAEAYFTQAPLRYGEYIAKLAVVPVSTEQQKLFDTKIDPEKDENALRKATVGYLRLYAAEFEVRVQLCTNLETMPVEDASKEWKEEESPYQTVARLIIPQQEAFSEARQQFVEGLSFAPGHSLVAHRPLGSIMRARLKVYPEMSRRRHTASGEPLLEPTSIQEVPN